MKEFNENLFKELRASDLPVDEYIVVASGPLGIRNLRPMNDVDILVTEKLWHELEQSYERFTEHGATKLRLSPNVEAMYQGSFEKPIPGAPTAAEQILGKEIIEGLPFQNIYTALEFKKKLPREKDKRDVELIETWLAEQQLS